MRVISGTARNTKLDTLSGEKTRPTIERVKEAMFSTLQFSLPGAKVLDLYAGSGQLGIEALSRGAAFAVFCDENNDAVQLVISNLKKCKLFTQSRVLCMDASSFLASCKEMFDIVLLDPPYGAGTHAQILGQVAAVCAPGAVVLCETEEAAEVPQECGGLELVKSYRYGKVHLHRYEKVQ